MDPAVSLVRAYLQFNGFFTVAEYPVLEAGPDGGFRTATDLDILAVRFNNTGHYVHDAGEAHDGKLYRAADPALELRNIDLEFIIGEIKQGAAELNRGARSPSVLRTGLQRFGAFSPESLDRTVDDLIQNGEARSRSGRARIRLFAFGSSRSQYLPRGVTTMLHGHMIGFLRTQMKTHADKVGVLDLKDDTLAMLGLIAKSRAWTDQEENS